MKTKDSDFTEFCYGDPSQDSTLYICKSLTKREYFAGLAMQSLIPAYITWSGKVINTCNSAVDFADALIEALNKDKE